MDVRMGFRRDRLGVGEWLLAGAGLAMLIDVLGLPWYSLSGTFSTTAHQLGVAATSASAVQSHALLAPLALICALLGLAIWGGIATRPGPALGMTLAAFAAVLDTLLLLGLLIRVLIAPPHVDLIGDPGVSTIHTDVAAWFGLLFAAALLAGTAMVLRRDGIPVADAPREIETLALTPRRA